MKVLLNASQVRVIEKFTEFFLQTYTHDRDDSSRGQALVKHYLARHCHNAEFNYCCGDLVSDPATYVGSSSNPFDPKRDRPYVSPTATIKTVCFKNIAILRLNTYAGGREDTERSNIIHWSEVYGFMPITNVFSISRSIQPIRTRDGRIGTAILLVETELAKLLPFETLNTPDIVGGYEMQLTARRLRISDLDNENTRLARDFIKELKIAPNLMIYKVTDLVKRN